MNLGRALMATLVVASIGAGCGSDGDSNASNASDAAGETADSAAAAPEQTSVQAPPATEANIDAAADAAAGGATEFGDNGGIEFTFSGGHEESGEYVWIPVASVFTSGWWAMSFIPPNTESAKVFSLSLNPASTNFSFGDGETTIFGTAPQCSFNIDHQDSSGAAGSLNCTGLSALTASGMASDVSITATFDTSM